MQKGANNGEAIEQMGGRYSAHSDREYQRYELHCFKDDVSRAIATLGDMIVSPNIDATTFEALKEEVGQEHEANHTRYFETTMENVHFNSFREHMMGQPRKGDRDMLPSITADHANEFHNANYFGDNVVVVASGNVDH